MQAAQRTPVRGPTFVRLLARLADVDAPPSNESLPDRLSQWLNWTQALALSGALDGTPPVSEADAATFGPAHEQECARVRAALAEAIAGIAGTTPRKTDGVADYGVYKQRYLTQQRAMHAATGRMRGMLRDMLTQASGDSARLAEVDAVMELALSPREQKLLGAVPALLGRHFEQLRDAAVAASALATDTWLVRFQKDMQSVLLAELDVRFQPVEALLEALRTR